MGKWSKRLLAAITILLGIEWIRLTVVLIKLRATGYASLIIDIMPLYYLVLIGIILGVGFMALLKQNENCNN